MSTKTENGETITYSLGAGDRLASWTGGAYSYDAAGCVTRIERDGKPTLDLEWNGLYQLVSVSTNGVFAEVYAYDALGRRVSTTTAEGTTRHVYDDNWQVIADIDEQGNAIVSYTWGAGIDNLLAVKIGGATYYPLTDIQGTVWGYVDTQNNIVARWQYDAWGNVVDEEIAPNVAALASIRYRFQCREWSAATGLINFRMRWYDPVTGRWLSKDPIGLSGGINLYAFCGDGPMERIDPFGLWGIWFGSIRLGNDEPWMIFDRSSLEDLKLGAAATADGVLSAATMNGLFGLFNPNVFDSYYDPCDQDIGVSHTLGSCSFSVLTIAFSIPQGIARGSSQVVTHWGPAGVTELRSGDWVMTGGASFRNWVMAGAKTSRQGWQASITTTVPKASLRYPSGWEWWKELIGQRVYKP